jgi:hypothetical protein
MWLLDLLTGIWGSTAAGFAGCFCCCRVCYGGGGNKQTEWSPNMSPCKPRELLLFRTSMYMHKSHDIVICYTYIFCSMVMVSWLSGIGIGHVTYLRFCVQFQMVILFLTSNTCDLVRSPQHFCEESVGSL